MKKFIAIMLAIALGLSLGACGRTSKAVVGKWYNSNNNELDVRSDGTWVLDGLYGSGKWKYLDDGKTIDFTDYYGEVYETQILEDGQGEFVRLEYYGNYYRNAYPRTVEKEETGVSQQGEAFAGFDDSLLPQEPETTEEPVQVLTVDPFDGIQYDFTGISPFCQISLNNQNCSEEAQLYVRYLVEGDYCANGDEVTLYAEVDTDSLPENTEVLLTSTEDIVTVEGQPYYIEDMQGLDFTDFISELNDYISSKTSVIGDYSLFGEHSFQVFEKDQFIIINAYGFAEKYGASGNMNLSKFKETRSVSEDSASLLVLKKNKISKYITGETHLYNILPVLTKCYCVVNGVNDDDENSPLYAEGNVYVCFYASNLICYPDGSIKFGTTDPEQFDFKYLASLESMDALKAMAIDQNRDDYNVIEIKGIKFIN